MSSFIQDRYDIHVCADMLSRQEEGSGFPGEPAERQLGRHSQHFLHVSRHERHGAAAEQYCGGGAGHLSQHGPGVSRHDVRTQGGIIGG